MTLSPFGSTITCVVLTVLLNCLCVYANAQEDVSFTGLSIDCLRYPTQQEYLSITNSDDYRALESYRGGADCAELPEIDFEKKILIGYKVIASGCGAPNYSMVLRKEGQVHYAEVTIHTRGICSMIVHDFFWFTIDKPKSSIDIRFSKKFVKSKDN